MSQAQLFAGIDVGGTSTRCVIADAAGSIGGIGCAGPGNALIAGHADALDTYRTALAKASPSMKLLPVYFLERLHFGDQAEILARLHQPASTSTTPC